MASFDGQNVNISTYTNQNKFEELILRIDNDITSKAISDIQINNHIASLSGTPINSKDAVLNTGINKIDTIANGLGESAKVMKDSIGGGVDKAAKYIGLEIPKVINMSQAGPLNQFRGKIALSAYQVPTGIALDTFDKLGKGIDDFIKDSLKIQAFQFKGTEILCSALCLVLSLLPCKITNQLVDDIQKIKDMQSSAALGTQFAIAAEKFGLNEINKGYSGGVSGLANAKDVKNSIDKVFKKNKTDDKTYTDAESIKVVLSSVAMVLQVINMVVSVVKVGFMDPKTLLGWAINGMFDILENVLLSLQALAVQMADKIINKVIAPIEAYFKNNNWPAYCGLSAQIIFRKILSIIYQFKNKLLQFIADLFAFQKGTRAKFKLFNDNMLWTLELSVVLKAFNLMLNNFLDIAIACGVSKRPCGDDKDYMAKDTINDVIFSEDGVYFMSPEGLTVNGGTIAPNPKTLNDIAKKMKPSIEKLFPGSNIDIYPGESRGELKNMPKLIAQLLGDINLGDRISLYQDGRNATIIYNNQSLCGA